MVNKNYQIWILESNKTCTDLYKIIFDVRFKTKYIETIEQLDFEITKGDIKRLPKLLITEISLSDGNFIEYFKKNKSYFDSLSYCIVSNIDDLEIMRFFYKNGAKGYYLKPIRSNELVSSVENTINNIEAISKVQINLLKGNLEHIIESLTSKEQQILNCLIHSNDYICTRDEIIEEIWKGMQVHQKTFDVHLCNLRTKLSKQGIKIHNLGQGKYALAKIEKYLKKI